MMISRPVALAGAAALAFMLGACGSGDATEEEAGTSPPTAASGPPTAQSAAASEKCGADKVEQFLSQKATPELRSQVEETVGNSKVRWLDPGTMLTMDHDPERLNIEVDEDGSITGARCG